MIEKKEIENLILYIKKAIKKELSKKNFEMVLELISNAAIILYNTNIYYEDDDFVCYYFEQNPACLYQLGFDLNRAE